MSEHFPAGAPVAPNYTEAIPAQRANLPHVSHGAAAEALTKPTAIEAADDTRAIDPNYYDAYKQGRLETPHFTTARQQQKVAEAADPFQAIEQEYADRKFAIQTEDIRQQYDQAEASLSTIGEDYAAQKEQILSSQGRHGGEGVSASDIIARVSSEGAPEAPKTTEIKSMGIMDAYNEAAKEMQASQDRKPGRLKRFGGKVLKAMGISRMVSDIRENVADIKQGNKEYDAQRAAKKAAAREAVAEVAMQAVTAAPAGSPKEKRFARTRAAASVAAEFAVATKNTVKNPIVRTVKDMRAEAADIRAEAKKYDAQKAARQAEIARARADELNK